MKTNKILKTILFLCLPIVLLAAGDKEVKWKAIRASKSKNCQEGKGICILKETKIQATDFVFALNDEGSMTIRINKDELETNQPDAYEDLVFSDQYEIEEDVILPEELCAALELEEEYTITSGSYPMEDNGEEFVIQITEEGMSSR